MGQATGYELLGIHIQQHVRNYIAPGFREPNHVFSNYLPYVIEDRARKLFQNFRACSLEDYLSNDEDNLTRKLWYIKSAITDFFERGFYKNAVGFDTPDSKKYSSIDELKQDISKKNSSVIRIDNCHLESTKKGKYALGKYDGLSLVARIRKISKKSVEIDFFNQSSYDLAGKPIEGPTHIFAQLRLTDKNIRDYQMEVLQFSDVEEK